MRKGILALALAGHLVAASAALPAPPCGKLTVLHSDGSKPGKSGFSAAATEDVLFEVLLLPTYDGDRLLELRVRTPRGHLYQSIAVPIADGQGRKDRDVPGYPRPVKVRVPAKVKDQGQSALRVAVPFPVGGTQIQTSSLYGAWTVELFVDGADEPCARAAEFTITR